MTGRTIIKKGNSWIIKYILFNGVLEEILHPVETPVLKQESLN